MFTVIIYVILLSLFFKNDKHKYLIILFGIYLISWVCTVSWNVIGAIELFKGSMTCRNKAESLCIVNLIILIFQWIVIFQILCLGECNLDNLPEYDKNNNIRPLDV
jgi:hypothetical protein